MKVIYRFVSDSPLGLSAFTGDRNGSSLPDRHGPWRQIGTIRLEQDMPYELDRRHVEKAINQMGYQLWRRKGPR